MMISIVVPIYNGENYIEDCLKSILVQTIKDWELLLVDNASEDDSVEICKKYAAKDDRIQVFKQHQNRGVSVARNLGIEKARGKFITFIDVDDWVEEDYLERLLTVQNKKAADMVICEYRKVYDQDRISLKKEAGEKISKISENNEHKIRNNDDKFQWKNYSVGEYLDKYFLEGNTHCWGVLFERELLEGSFFQKGITIGEDMLFLLEVAQKAKNIVVINYRGYNYYINETGAMKKRFTISYTDQIICWEKALEIMERNYPELVTKVQSIIVVSILLVVAKLSELESSERKRYVDIENECYQTFLKYANNQKIRRFLPKSYLVKRNIYKCFPKFYMKVYGKLR